MANKVVISVVSLTLTFGLIGVVGWALWDDWDKEQEKKKTQPQEISPGVYKIPVDKDISWISNIVTKSFGLAVGDVNGHLGVNVPFDGVVQCPEGPTVCGQWPDGRKISVVKSPSESPDLTCVTVEWAGHPLASGRDCWDIGSAHWFGGFEEYHQTWPMSEAIVHESAFVTGNAWDSGQYGGVIEPLFVSSAGVGIHVDEATPLYLSVNEKKGRMCLIGVAGSDFAFSSDPNNPVLRYDVCKASDVTTLWKAMAKKYLKQPSSPISKDVLTNPIWCTWAKYKGAINQTKVLDFATQITKHGFGVSQLEIDDNWTHKYGDMDFDTTKFPNASDMINKLSVKGIPVTVWVHPFFNNDSMNFEVFSNISGLVKSSETGEPALTSWWRGDGDAGILDVTNPVAVRMFLKQLEDLRQNYNVTSFKFDAGETNWLPRNSKFHHDLSNPSVYTQKYVAMAYTSDNTSLRQEVRSAYRSQSSSLMVRMLDRASNWSGNRGLKTVIPCALTFGLMGYPFVLPDLIGGNAMDQSNLTRLDAVMLPDKELFIRWLQLSTFLPVMQFSVAPWDYTDDNVTNIAKKFVTLHQKYADTIFKLSEEAVSTGQPIVRPLWWTDPSDKEAMTIDSEFLLGDDLLVAPVLEKGQTSRDIYLPSGRWLDQLRNQSLTGPDWKRNYTVRLDELAYFTRVN